MQRGEQTRQKIITACVILARQGMTAVTGSAVAELAGMSHPAVSYHYRSNVALRRAAAEAVIAARDPEAVARLILDKHPICERLTRAERMAFLERAAG
jgi:AcrR family transcriptional regulator